MPGEEGELTRALRELSALMTGLTEDLVVESLAHRRALLRVALPSMLRAVLNQTYEGEPANVVVLVQETLDSVARALAKVNCVSVCISRTLFPCTPHLTVKSRSASRI